LIKGKQLFKYLFSRMGNDSFFQWMKDFIHSNQEKNVNANILIDSLPPKITSDLKPWIYQAGIPLITLEETGTPNMYKFSQKRFYSHFPLVHETEKWNISIAAMNSTGGSSRIEFNVISLILIL
jgi:aminopeptidase N